MGVNYFTKEQVQELEANEFVQKVSEKAITYTEDFRRHFSEAYHQGKLPSQIFSEAGFNIEALGQRRIDNFAYRIKQMEIRPEGFEDQRAYSSGRPSHKERTPEEELAYLRHQLAIKDQQIEDLKKTASINQKAEMKRKKNLRSSK